MVEKSPNSLNVVRRAFRSKISGTEKAVLDVQAGRALPDINEMVFVAVDQRPQEHSAHQAENRRVGADPSASVKTTVKVRPLLRHSDRNATFRSCKIRSGFTIDIAYPTERATRSSLCRSCNPPARNNIGYLIARQSDKSLPV